MMDRKILACMLAIGLVSVMATAATFTWLSDKEEISWTIQVKTADIDAPESITFGGEFAPGETKSTEITIENVGEVTLDVTISAKAHNWVTFTFDPSEFTLGSGYPQTVTVTATLSGDYQTSDGTVTGTIIVDAVQAH